MLETIENQTTLATEIRTAVRHSAVYSLGSILAKALGFLMLPFYTHYLGPGDYGLLEILDLSVSLLGMVLHMGIAPALLRSYAAAPTPAKKEKAVSTVCLFAGATGLVTFLIGIGLIRPVSSTLFGPAVPSKYLLLSFSAFILSYVADPFRIYLRALQASGKLVMLETSSTLLLLALNIFFIAGLKIGLIGILLSSVLVNILWNLLAARMLLRVGLRFSAPLLRQMMRFGLPLIFSNLAAFSLNFSDRFFLQHFRTLEVVGLYAVGYKFGFMINFLLVQPFSVMWQSRMYAVQANSDHAEILNQMFVLYSLVLTYAALALALLSPEIVRIMVGPKFAPAATVIPIICLAYVVCGVGSYLQTGMYLANKTRLIGAISAVAAMVSLVLNYVLIRHYGILGAAWATVLSFGVVAIGSYRFSQKVFPLRLSLGRVAVAVAIGTGLYLPFQWWTPAAFPVAVLIKLTILAAFPVILWRCRLISAEETAKLASTQGKTVAVWLRFFGGVFGKKQVYDS
jgi:O-antigen/teichoic acid export membrane protein